ncbi:hypothetical protein UFOVP35_3 [uncultured Caudovirales phage]|uniref:Uncharacterized protein n=1 Tax=uncultured Caudovirales phage TaxID=2100421 RepID=A0A6J5KM03_9CAUD|nr:hypothetical protein UFOVP35_3 [uncultured Caudovirales phage]CAB4124665.1 hypothetical protein UFOVP52_44 [uncultured Caudovirales phage]CAB5219925.1 hypothetical protein UFOVP234_69 [uncultured Caudovirales phage]
MGQFKPMVKMETTEPSVILKLKKGGHVNRKEESKEEHGHKAMSCDDSYASGGSSPKKPSMKERRNAMFVTSMKKGGKADGGLMGPPVGAPVRSGLPAVSPAVARALAARAIANRPAATPAMMKKGGSSDLAQDKAMIKKAFKEHDMQEHKGDKGTKIKLKTGGTVEGNAGKFLNKINDADKKDTSIGKTGSVKEGAAGYKDGGTITGNVGKFAKTKMHDGDKKDTSIGKTGEVKAGLAGYKKGGTINGNEMKFVNDNVNDGDKFDSAHGTTGVREGAGGYKKGGTAKKAYATGGSVINDGGPVAYPKHFVSKPISNIAQSGTFKKGGSVSKFADGGGVDAMKRLLGAK